MIFVKFNALITCVTYLMLTVFLLQLPEPYMSILSESVVVCRDC